MLGPAGQPLANELTSVASRNSLPCTIGGRQFDIVYPTAHRLTLVVMKP